MHHAECPRDFVVRWQIQMRLLLRSGSEKCVPFFFLVLSQDAVDLRWGPVVSHIILSKKKRLNAGEKKRSALRQRNARERRRSHGMASSISKRSLGKKSGNLAPSLGLARNFNQYCRLGTRGARRVKMPSCLRRTRARLWRSPRYASDSRT